VDRRISYCENLRPCESGILADDAQAYECLTNAILMEPRVWHLNDPSIMVKLQQYCMSIFIEVRLKLTGVVAGNSEWTRTKAWKRGDITQLKRDVSRRIEQEGWHTVREALSLYVRCVRAILPIMTSTHSIPSSSTLWDSFVQGGLFGRYEDAESQQNEVFEFLTWGTGKWKDIPTKDKGVIFTSSFIRAVRSMHLDSYTRVLSCFLIHDTLTNRCSRRLELGPHSPIPPNTPWFACLTSHRRHWRKSERISTTRMKA
jgi:hypothetical protein